MEANPASIDADGLSALRSIGFNRISIGVQSMADEELSALKKECVRRLKPMVGELEVNSIAEEKGYTG